MTTRRRRRLERLVRIGRHREIPVELDAAAIQGGVTMRGGWPEVWRANLEIRGASRILARIGEPDPGARR